MLYVILQRLALLAARLTSGLNVQGREHIPNHGPFLLIANHQSILDPILIQAACPRPIHAMAKSTQFASPIMRRVMTAVYAFPVRRYQVDPQAVRNALRTLWDGAGVGIYIEGERSWDGVLQPPRLGVLRLMLKAGVPVIPTVITGSYDAWPRWASRPQIRGIDPIRIRFLAPMRFPTLHRRAEREEYLPEAARKIMGALAAALGQQNPAEKLFHDSHTGTEG